LIVHEFDAVIAGGGLNGLSLWRTSLRRIGETGRCWSSTTHTRGRQR
jgi:hypothetical protein